MSLATLLGFQDPTFAAPNGLLSLLIWLLLIVLVIWVIVTLVRKF